MQCPKSATNMYINCTGLIISLATAYYLSNYHSDIAIKTTGIVLVCLAYGIPVILLEWLFLKTYRAESTGLDWNKIKVPGDIKRSAIKLLGLYMCFGFVAFVYWLFPEYHGQFHENYFALLKQAALWLIVLSVPYIYFVDKIMSEPDDGYYQLGLWCLGKNKNLDKKMVSQLFLGWLVKLFFLPLMFAYTGSNLVSLFRTDVTTLFDDFQVLYNFTYLTIFYIDLFIVVIGYASTMRIFDNHIRSTEPTFFGWIMALMCYQPFWTTFSNLYLGYGQGPKWGYWLQDSALFYTAWGSLILVVLAIYTWATVAFGMRFSNLTHRGIITNGPYRFTKHPAYIAKNLSWWMISMPFMINGSPEVTIRHCAMLLILNFIYLMRARTEERHLSFDPVYCEYAAYIEKHGIFACAGKIIPALRFQQGRLFYSSA